MSNWIIDIDNMILRHKNDKLTRKIKYDPHKNMVYYYWQDGKWDGWDTCVPEIIDEYLKQANKRAEEILLGVDDE